MITPAAKLSTKAKLLALSAAALVVTGCTTTSNAPSSSSTDAMLARMLSGQSAMQGSQLRAAIDKASAHPLGSKENPVRVHMPTGQRAYLSRLDCEGGETPDFFRVGNFGVGVFGNIIDGYEVTCPNSGPDKSLIFMDMYHPGNVEDRAVDGFGIDGSNAASAQT